MLKDLCEKNKMVMSLLIDQFRLLFYLPNIAASDAMQCTFAGYSVHRVPTYCMCLRRFWQDVDSTGLGGYKASIMALSDGGKLYRTELEIVLCRDSTL